MALKGKLTKTRALTGTITRSGGGGSVQEIYWVQYGIGTATNAEVNEAVAANKLPICYWDSTDAYGRPRRTLYFLIRNTPTESFFSGVDYINNTIIVRRLYADAWDTQTIRYEGKLTWDQTPRFGSVNPVTSGGIYNAIQNATVSDERIAEAVDDWMDANVPSIGTLSYAAKQALLNCFAHVAWIDDQGQSYYNALESELFQDATLESITAVFTQGSAVIYDTDSLDTLKQYLTVTATFSDSTTETVTDYTLSGTLTVGTSTITVSYGGKTATFTVTVTASPLYALPNNTHETSEYKVVTNNRGHIAIDIYTTVTPYYPANGFGFNPYIGVIDTMTSPDVLINNQNTKFTFPANSSVEWGIKNISNNDSIKFTGNYRIANGTTSVQGLGLSQIIHTTDETVTYMISSATDVGTLFFYIDEYPLTGPKHLEFDVFCNVNGVRYI